MKVIFLGSVYLDGALKQPTKAPGTSGPKAKISDCWHVLWQLRITLESQWQQALG